jgi:hypothetical protein
MKVVEAVNVLDVFEATVRDVAQERVMAEMTGTGRDLLTECVR